MQCGLVGLGIDGDCRDGELPGGPDDTYGDLTTIGNEDFLDSSSLPGLASAPSAGLLASALDHQMSNAAFAVGTPSNCTA